MRFPIGQKVITRPSAGSRPEPPLPSAPRQVLNLARDLVAAGREALRGKPILASAEQREANRAECRACRWFRPSDERCAHASCGCFLAVKTWLWRSACPLGKHKSG